MKKFFLFALMAALGFSMMQAQQSSPTKIRLPLISTRCSK